MFQTSSFHCRADNGCRVSWMVSFSVTFWSVLCHLARYLRLHFWVSKARFFRAAITGNMKKALKNDRTLDQDRHQLPSNGSRTLCHANEFFFFLQKYETTASISSRTWLVPHTRPITHGGWHPRFYIGQMQNFLQLLVISHINAVHLRILKGQNGESS